MTEPVAIERRDDARLSTLERIFGTGDMVQLIAATKDNVNAAIAFAREREYVSEYPIERKGKRVGTRLWFHHPTWQLLGQSFGITAYTEGDPVEVKPGTWQAAAIAATIETGQTVGRAVGMASKGEPGKQGMADHHLSAIAQARAQRNALRSCLGAVLIAAGFEISDPEAPITNEQLAILYVLERELGLTHEQGHADAGVSSYTKLTRDQAGDVIDRWQALRDGQASDAVSTSLSSVGDEEPPTPETVTGKADGGAGGSSPATDEAWDRKPKDMSLSGAIKLAAKMHSLGQLPEPGPDMTSPPRKRSDFTGEQLAKVGAWWRDGERG